MRGVALIAFCWATVQAQTPMAVGYLHGGFVAANGTAAAGEIELRAANDNLYSCFYDSRTYVERAHARIAMTDLASGEPIEVLADRRAGSSNCYTRMVYVVNRRPMPNLDPLLNRPLGAMPRGDVTFAGAVLSIDGYQLAIRTRAGDVALRVRNDTRFVSGGLRVERRELPVNTHIFVRAGRDIWGELEAYEVMWGEIVP